MRKRWIIPLAILIILILAFVFRWDYGPTTTHNNGAIKLEHKVDRWTGRPWEVVNGRGNYYDYSNYEIPYVKTGKGLSTDQGIENARKERDNATKVWLILVISASGLTFFYYIKDSKEIVITKTGGGGDT